MRILCLALGVLFILSLSLSCNASESVLAKKDQRYLQGKKVFRKYCSSCHGVNADGRGKAIRLYMKLGSVHPSNFQIRYYSDRSEEYLTSIIRDGGEKHSLSQYMPPFEYELSSSQIKDVVHFIKKVSIYNSNFSNSDKLDAESALEK